ncbi:PDZ and LIM domain protein Zasp [Pseudolycoriella hygida]|uniref:PDZ and LIM domain protein Zasp n=1 Tax=Pseudolycoriella hygida TaxID=35572 RepID=A0A9Q0N518_9DIPT|nr:PDZ and LIM domain protein Zasp [Pseudolycoriella hygida]
MAQLITVRLSRVDAQPWGLRLQGGKDFGTPLVVQKTRILQRILCSSNFIQRPSKGTLIFEVYLKIFKAN